MVRRARLAECVHVATDTLGGETKAIKLADSANFMARIAIHHRVSADQRKPVLMLIDIVNRHLPAVGIVAKLAFRTIFPTMQISVAVLALVRNIAEVKVGVAIHALHFCVAAA